MFRAAFDSALPLVATSAFQAEADVVAAGAVFNWRARGIPEVDVLALFGVGLLMHPDPAVAPGSPAPAKSRSQPRR